MSGQVVRTIDFQTVHVCMLRAVVKLNSSAVSAGKLLHCLHSCFVVGKVILPCTDFMVCMLLTKNLTLKYSTSICKYKNLFNNTALSQNICFLKYLATGSDAGCQFGCLTIKFFTQKTFFTVLLVQLTYKVSDLL